MNFLDTRLPAKFWAKCIPEPNSGCWLWLGWTNGRGYGRFWYDSSNYYAHRLSYEKACGRIREGFVIDHLCRNPSCCNPRHLEAVTLSVNSARGDLGRARGCVGHNMAKKTHCPQGHPYDERNTYRGSPRLRVLRAIRTCRTCSRDRATEKRKAGA